MNNQPNISKEKSRSKLACLFANGNITNENFHCAICDSNKPIHKHHENYELWYSFIPLCPECHGKLRLKGKIVFHHGVVENLTILRDTGIRESGHIVWLAKDNLNNKYHVRIYNNKIIQKSDKLEP